MPTWLRGVVDLGPGISEYLRSSYRNIQEVEAARIQEAYDAEDEGGAFEFSAAWGPGNESRNRYSDIVPYDSTRVVLMTPLEPEESDYINASHVHGLPGTIPCIFSQGPLPETIGDFWQMVWEQNSSLIVMLTKEEERGRVKCSRYVPESVGGTLTCANLGEILIKMESEESHSNGEVILRRLTISSGGKSRELWQLHFTAWPDHSASNPASVLSVIDLSRELQKQGASAGATGPVVIHCSAGCGRTGTFCAIDGVLRLLEKTKSPSDIDEDIIRKTVEKLRESRIAAVQMIEQFAFCYEAVLYRLLEWQHGIAPGRPDWIAQAPSKLTSTSPPDGATPRLGNQGLNG
ncbi:protein-tyrosine phosphatase-like protein [Fimicolochytrium jonesii]|uniref:protein-tyrosine phosphatase-like protein n=1 Tax=Fimicolochytrium jonesii TaxID=1396493 RepID=UPI0022FE8E3B|nr:protein-tyrosine phosphatase-like protein [Fimicolochytrium jonesii]KAI8818360.1 protein-tyrosine phosphatase-like protein [Fimicolochytrium jonesii]